MVRLEAVINHNGSSYSNERCDDIMSREGKLTKQEVLIVCIALFSFLPVALSATASTNTVQSVLPAPAKVVFSVNVVVPLWPL